MEGLKKRHHYGTTGSRVALETKAIFDTPADLFNGDPNLVDATPEKTSEAMMGDILRSGDREVTFRIDVHGPSPIERIKLVDNRDNALYVRITHEDGHFVWSSPIYIFR